MLAAVAAVVSVGAFAGYNTSRPTDAASDLMLANAEALAEPIVEIVYADGCLSGYDDVCVKTPFQWFRDSLPVYN